MSCWAEIPQALRSSHVYPSQVMLIPAPPAAALHRKVRNRAIIASVLSPGRLANDMSSVIACSLLSSPSGAKCAAKVVKR